jgi:hypothetical protein
MLERGMLQKWSIEIGEPCRMLAEARLDDGQTEFLQTSDDERVKGQRIIICPLVYL